MRAWRSEISAYPRYELKHSKAVLLRFLRRSVHQNKSLADLKILQAAKAKKYITVEQLSA
jgi:hypothetical protein